MSQKDIYKEIWDKFEVSDKAIINPSFPKEQAYSITINIPLPKSISSKINKIILKLKEKYPHNEFIAREKYHITLFAVGVVGENYDKHILEKVSNELNKISYFFNPFEVEIKGLNHFLSLIFVQAFSNDKKIFQLNKKISNHLNINETFPYVPHISAIFFKSNPYELFKEIEKKYRESNFGKFKVKEIELIEWDLHPKSGISSPKIIKKFRLNERTQNNLIKSKKQCATTP